MSSVAVLDTQPPVFGFLRTTRVRPSRAPCVTCYQVCVPKVAWSLMYSGGYRKPSATSATICLPRSFNSWRHLRHPLYAAIALWYRPLVRGSMCFTWPK